MDELLRRFLIISPIAVSVYYFLPRRTQNYWLLMVSYAFYASWMWTFAAILLLLTLVNFVLAQEIELAQRHKRALLGMGVAFNVLLAGFFRHPLFFLRPSILPLAQRVLIAVGMQPDVLSLILLPLGLSFAILQMISYLTDVYRSQVKASTDFVDFALYVAYFPKLISGPIERARDFLPVLAQQRIVDNHQLATSLGLVIIGLFRKLVIANSLTSMAPSDLFTNPQNYAAPTLLIWLIAYSFALYNDFAGYTSMARGISGLFGIPLSSNFQQPYFARNFTEFWQRWHITFSSWLRDYIYYPVTRMLLRRSRGQRNVWILVLPPMVTMFVSGLWHSASGHMLLWGGLHGLFQILDRVGARGRPIIAPDQQPAWRQAITMVATFILVVIAWIPFKLTLAKSGEFLESLANWNDAFFVDGRVITLLIPAIMLDVIQYRKGELAFLNWPRLAQSTALAIALLAIVLVLRASVESSPFVYQGF